MKNLYTLTASRATTSKEVTVEWDKLTPEVQAYVIEYGLKQSMADRAAKHTKDLYPNEDKWAEAGVEAMIDFIDSLKKGNVPTSGGGRTTDPLTLELRAMVADRLKAAGLKAAEAKKKAKTPKDGFAFLVQAAMANKLKCTFDEVDTDGEDFQAALEANWTPIVEAAQATIKARQSALGSIEL